MGYETQLIIGLATDSSYTDSSKYFITYASIDMCKMGDSALLDLDWINRSPEDEKWYFYSICDDGDAPITKDRYDSIFKPVSIEDAITALEKDVEESDYRRFKWALALLKAMKADSTDQLSVILWGY